MRKRGGRVEYQPGFAALVADQLQSAIDVLAALGMKSDITGPGRGKIGNDPIHRADHQVHIDRRRYPVLAQRFANQRTNGEIRHVVIVHHIKVDDVGAGGQHVVDFLAQPCKIGRQDGRCDQVVFHGYWLWVWGERYSLADTQTQRITIKSADSPR